MPIIVKGRPFKHGRVIITSPPAGTRRVDSTSSIDEHPEPMIVAADYRPMPGPADTILPEPRSTPPSSDPPGPAVIGHQGERLLRKTDRLVDLGYAVGEIVRLHRIRPHAQIIAGVTVDDTVTVGDFIRRVTRTSYGVRLGRDAPGGDSGYLFLYVLAEADFEIDIEGGHYLMENE